MMYVLLALGLACGVDRGAVEKPLLVGVAANAAPALEEIARLWEQRGGVAVTMTAGSTGLLARQIREGAAIDVFVSADEGFVDALIGEGVLDGHTRAVYAVGRLALAGGELDGAKTSPEDIAAALRQARRIAIANPETAPYGRAAREAMEKLGVWNEIESRLVFGQDVGQALQYAKTGNVDLAFAPASLLVDSELRSLAIPANLHAPIRQALAVRAENPSIHAAPFAAFIGSDEAKAILARRGYDFDTAKAP